MKQEKLNTPPPLQADNRPPTVREITYQAKINLAKVKALQAKKKLKTVNIDYGETNTKVLVRQSMSDAEAKKRFKDSRDEQYKFW